MYRRAGRDWAGTPGTSQCPHRLCLWVCLEALAKNWELFCVRQRAASVVPVPGSSQLKKTRGGTGRHHSARSKGRSLHRASLACCQAFLGGSQERSSGEDKGSIAQWKGKSCVIYIPKQVSVGSSASTVRCLVQGGEAEGLKENNQAAVMQVPSSARESVLETAVIETNCWWICDLYRQTDNVA